MTEIECKRCGASDYVKNGTVRGLQRYRCQQCACNFTATQPCGKPLGHEGSGVVAVRYGQYELLQYCAYSEGQRCRRAQMDTRRSGQVTRARKSCGRRAAAIDEMWYFKKRPKSFGSGGPMILCSGEPWPGCWVSVTMQPSPSRGQALPTTPR